MRVRMHNYYYEGFQSKRDKHISDIFPFNCPKLSFAIHLNVQLSRSATGRVAPYTLKVFQQQMQFIIFTPRIPLRRLAQQPDVSLRLALSILILCRSRENTGTLRQT